MKEKLKVYNLPSDTLAGTAPWSNQKDTQETITSIQQGM